MKLNLILILLLFSNILLARITKTDLKLFKNGKEIKQGEILYINSKPDYPELIAKLDNCDDGIINWKLEVKFKRPNRHEKPSTTITFKGNNKWNISKLINTSQYTGGIAILTAQKEKTKYILNFNIRGLNPSREEVLNYIGDTPWYAKAIAVHESGHQKGKTLCQFNEVGTVGENYITNIKNTPNRGNDMKGWGIFQITTPEPNNSDLWNWKQNIDTGKKILSSKLKLSQAYFDAIKRTYPKEYEAPPSIYVPSGTKTKLTAIEASAIQLYNGGSVVESLINPYGKYSNYISGWKFYPNRKKGNRWAFIPNRNNYVYQVISTNESILNK